MSGVRGFLVLVLYVIVVWTAISVLIVAVGAALGWRATRHRVQAAPSSGHVVRLDRYDLRHEARARAHAKSSAR
jgi:hypothetical protein